VGMEASEVVVAINSDPKAPIFEVADIGIVGDFREILPPLLEEIRHRLRDQKA
jgi:electron transfer flavoprotein alpha subunit